MAKNKIKEYLPLKWCKNFTEQVAELDNISLEDLKKLALGDENEKIYTIKKYPKLRRVCDAIQKRDPNLSLIFAAGDESSTTKMFHEFLTDMDAVYNVLSWSKNKQVFKFDDDFINELIRTEDIYMVKDVFDYLPFNQFYIDFSDNKNLVEKIYCHGVFVFVEKVLFEKGQIEQYRFHLCKVTEEKYFNDILFFENKDGEHELLCEDEMATVSILNHDEKGKRIKDTTITFNARIYESVIFQILMYLSSVDADIEHNQTTQQTYRKPNPNQPPKNKFSEVKAYDVGVRFGSAFRNWKKTNVDNASTENNSPRKEGGSRGAGTPKRPHARRAHYSYYWYGKRDSDERVRRPKWIEATFVGLDKVKGEQPAVIHKVKTEKKDNEVER